MDCYISPASISYTHNSLWHRFIDSCERFKNRPLYGTKSPKGEYEWITYADLLAEVTLLRGGLAQLGVVSGDRIALISPNSTQWAATAYAALSLGAIIVPMYPNQSLSEMEYIINDSGAKVVLYYTTTLSETIRGIQSRVTTLAQAICIDAPVSTPTSYKALLTLGKNNPAATTPPSLDDIFSIIYTSGTTGNPKGVMLTHRNLLHNIDAVLMMHSFRKEDVFLSILPWAHIYGQCGDLHTVISVGASAAFAEGPKQITTNLKEIQPTVMLCVPKILSKIYLGIQQMMYQKPRPIRWLFRRGVEISGKIFDGETATFQERLIHFAADLLIFSKIHTLFGGRLKNLISGAAALDPKIGRFICSIGMQVYEGYGLTETSPMISNNNPIRRKIGSAGAIIPGMKVVIDRSTHNFTTHDGEIIAYGNGIMKGYYKHPEETAQVMTPDGGFRTGDIGYIDEDGFLFITGRIKEQYKLENGKYVTPSPLEEKLKLCRFFDNAFVSGDGMEHNVSVLSVNHDNLIALGTKLNLNMKLEELIQHPDIRTALSKEIHKTNKAFKNFEKIVHFILTTDEWTAENNLLTQTLKLKRREIFPRYAQQIAALYDPQTKRVLDNPLLAIEKL